MTFFTERNGMRSPSKQTYTITPIEYRLLLACCFDYKNHLTYLFKKQMHYDFLNEDYIKFDEERFSDQLYIEIPNLFRIDEEIAKPDDYDEYDQYSLLDLIEFFAKNIKDTDEYWKNAQYRNYLVIDCLESSNVFNTFQNQINQIF